MTGVLHQVGTLGVAPQEYDEDFNFEQALREIHQELAILDDEAIGLAKQIQLNFEGLML